MSSQQSFEEEIELERTKNRVPGVKYILQRIVRGEDRPVAPRNPTIILVLPIDFWAELVVLMGQGPYRP